MVKSIASSWKHVYLQDINSGSVILAVSSNYTSTHLSVNTQNVKLLNQQGPFPNVGRQISMFLSYKYRNGYVYNFNTFNEYKFCDPDPEIFLVNTSTYNRSTMCNFQMKYYNSKKLMELRPKFLEMPYRETCKVTSFLYISCTKNLLQYYLFLYVFYLRQMKIQNMFYFIN